MSPREVVCSCGAINDETFGTCIRCGQPPGQGAAQAVRYRVRVRATEEHEPVGFGRAALLLGGICTAVFALQIATALKHGVPIYALFMSSGTNEDTYRAGAMVVSAEAFAVAPHRLLSAVFVHLGFLHFAMNMLGFMNLARIAESLVGAGRTIIAFCLTGALGFASTLVLNVITDGSPFITAGASGGILGVMGLHLGVLVRRRDPKWVNLALNVLFFAVLFGFAVNSSNAGVRINNSAHVGGLVSGFALGWLWSKSGNSETKATRIGSGVAVVASVASIVLSMTLLTERLSGLY